MKAITLTQAKVALVDDADFEWLNHWKWFAMRNGKHWCAGRNRPKQNGKRGTIYMHCQILGFPSSEVDHRDRNGLHNWRANLRLATDLQQVLNREKPKNRLGLKGVKRKIHTFEARICHLGKPRTIGHYATPEAAARAYDREARKLFGEFAVLNFPEAP